MFPEVVAWDVYGDGNGGRVFLSNIHEAVAQDPGGNPKVYTVLTYNPFVVSLEGIGAELADGVTQAT